MKGEASLLDRYAVYTQLQQLLTPSSSNSVLQLFPPDTRAVWQALGAAAAATAAKHSRAGDAPEVQQEMALQRLQQLLEAAARGEPVSLETEAKDDEAPQLLLNKVIPQVLAHKPFTDLRSFQEEKLMLLGSAEDCIEGNRCVNKEQVLLSLVFDPEEVRGTVLEASASGRPFGSSSGGPFRMNDDIRVHWRWQQRRVQQMKGRMQRRMLGPPNGVQVKPEKTEGEEPGKRKVEGAEIAGDEDETEAVNAAVRR